MSTATLSPVVAGPRLSAGGVLRSEWIKLRSLRSTVWSFALVIAMSYGLAVLLAVTVPIEAAGLPAAGQVATVVATATNGLMLGQLVVAVLGVLVISGEYSTGMIRSTLAAVPRRLPALWAKAVVLFVTTFVVGAVSTFGGFLIAAPLMAGSGLEASLLDDGVVPALLGGALYLALIAVIALGLGAVLRSGAGGISAAVGVVLLLPVILQLIPAEWAADLVQFTPAAAGDALYSMPADRIAGDPELWQGALTLAVWVAVTLGSAAVLLKRRDA